MNTGPRDFTGWNEDRFQMLTRVIDAITFDLEPGARTVMVAEYLARTARAEIAGFRRRHRARKKRSIPSKRNQPRQ